MSRASLAFLIGTVGFIAYIAAVTALGDLVVHRHWALQFVYYIAAGILWVWPALALIKWSVRKG